MTKTNLVQLSILIVIGWVLAACAQFVNVAPTPPFPTATVPPTTTALPGPEPQWHLDWLNDTTCSLPCWHSIVPGKTTVAEAMQILQTLKASDQIADVVQDDFEIGTTHGGVIQWRWLTNPTTGDGGMTFGIPEQIISTIKLTYDPGFDLQAIFAADGEPSHIYAVATQLMNGRVQYGAALVYRNKGFIIFGSSDTKPVRIPDMRFSTLSLTSYEEWSDDSPPLLAWEGWQNFDFYCRDSNTGQTCK